MKITIESTDRIVRMNGVPARIWEGKTESGIEVTCFITKIGVNAQDDTSQFEKELKETKPPSGYLGQNVMRDLIFDADLD